MRILAIETSCDETAVAVLEAEGEFPRATYNVRGHALFSQIDIHREYGGVFPTIAKREHARTLVPMFEKAVRDAECSLAPRTISDRERARVFEILSRETGLADALFSYAETTGLPTDIDCIAVTQGPGLEPALWVGISFAKALAILLAKPLIPVNHMEGHVVSSLFHNNEIAPVTFPLVSLLISGGHTELVLSKEWGRYEKIGGTRDDAVGEAFDKAARVLGLPYPGGPEIERAAREARERAIASPIALPRPMIKTPDLDFSFSGLKTAVLYAVRDMEKTAPLTREQICGIGREFQDAVTEVLITKTKRALATTEAHTLIVGGGVSASAYIKQVFESEFGSSVALYFPDRAIATDNAVMIALAAHAVISQSPERAVRDIEAISASGNLSLRTV